MDTNGPLLDVLADNERAAREVESTVGELARLLVGHSEPHESGVLVVDEISVWERLGKLNLRQGQTLATLRLVHRMLIGDDADKAVAVNEAKVMYADREMTAVRPF